MWFITHQPLCQIGNFLCRDHPLWKGLEYSQDSKWVVGRGSELMEGGVFGIKDSGTVWKHLP